MTCSITITELTITKPNDNDGIIATRKFELNQYKLAVSG